MVSCVYHKLFSVNSTLQLRAETKEKILIEKVTRFRFVLFFCSLLLLRSLVRLNGGPNCSLQCTTIQHKHQIHAHSAKIHRMCICLSRSIWSIHCVVELLLFSIQKRSSRASNFGSIFTVEKPCHIFVPQNASAVDRAVREKLAANKHNSHAEFSSSSSSFS